MLANDPTESVEIEELDDTEYLWFCNECRTVFDGTHANFPQDGICDPCLTKKLKPILVEDIPF